MASNPSSAIDACSTYEAESISLVGAKTRA
jgi:hypothetical protein